MSPTRNLIEAIVSLVKMLADIEGNSIGDAFVRVVINSGIDEEEAKLIAEKLGYIFREENHAEG